MSSRTTIGDRIGEAALSLSLPTHTIQLSNQKENVKSLIDIFTCPVDEKCTWSARDVQLEWNEVNVFEPSSDHKLVRATGEYKLLLLPWRRPISGIEKEENI